MYKITYNKEANCICERWILLLKYHYIYENSHVKEIL